MTPEDTKPTPLAEGPTPGKGRPKRVGKWPQNHKTLLIPVGILLVGFILAFFLYQLAVYPKTLLLSETGTNGEAAGSFSAPVRNGQVFEQEIALTEGADGIGPRISLQSREDANLAVTGRLLDANGAEAATFAETFPQAEDEMRLPLPFSAHVEAGTYTLEFAVEGLADEAVLRFFLTAGTPAYSVDGLPAGESLSLATYTTSGFLTPYFWGIAVPIVLVLALAWVLVFVVKAKFQNIFLLLGAVLGVVFMFVFPPYSMYDEAGHIQNALYYSSLLTGDQSPGDKTLTRRAEDDITGFKHLAPRRDQYYHISAHLLDRAESDEMVEDTTLSLYGQPTQYIVPALGITLARGLGIGQVGTLFMGGLFQLALYLALLYFAIRLSPFKALFTMLGLLPFLLCSAGGFLYDVPINALSFLLAGYVFHLAFTKPKMRWWDILLLAVLVILIVPMKYVYLPLVLLPLLIPKARWPRPVAKRIFCIVLIVAAVAVAGALVGAQALAKLGTASATAADGTAVYTYGALFHYPREFPRLFLATFIDQMGILLRAGEFDLILATPGWLHAVMAALLLLAVFPAKNDNPLLLKRWQKGWMALIALLVYALVLIAALIWTPIGSYHIAGLQGRYWVPVLPLVVLLAQGLLRKPRENDRALVYGMGCVTVFTILYIFVQTAHNQVTVTN